MFTGERGAGEGFKYKIDIMIILLQYDKIFKEKNIF